MSDAPAAAWRSNLRRIGMAGTLLGLLVLIASMVLRIETVFDLQGVATSTLAPGVEKVIRLVHRMAASCVALLTLAAAVLCWMYGRSSRAAWLPVAWVAISTLTLSVIGPMTTGYRLPWVTIANVGFGMALLMGFWWLREIMLADADRWGRSDLFQRATVAAFVLHTATGAAASAALAQGARLPVLLHLMTLAIWLVLCGSMLLLPVADRCASRLRLALVALLGAQMLTGYLAMMPPQRAGALLLSHALLSPALALLLVSLFVRQNVWPAIRHSPPPVRSQ
ncbi:MAG: hypothetical protein IAE92_10885 [Burkholderiaceae bacterium]|nr:hypothetical protein [Burkholderiaceae bacterium]